MLLCRIDGGNWKHSSWLISTSCTAIGEAALLVCWTTHAEIASGENKSSHINCHVHSTLCIACSSSYCRLIESLASFRALK